MEAVPRLPMLGFDLKTSAESIEFGPKLRQYIREHYNEEPDSYSGEIHELESLRASATHAPHDFTGCSLLKKYYCQLHFLLSRFPLTENPAIAITFNWYDIYSNVAYNVTDVKYEMSCILYNIGALHTDLGAMDARNTPDGMKISCTHFQCAAWAFQHLRETYPQPRESDLSPTLLTFMYSVALAQAQECILEKSMTDNRKPTIIAKVAMQVVEYLKAAMKTMWSGKSSDATFTEIVGSRKLKTWRKYCEFKMSYYGAVALLYQGLQAEEQQKMGERVAYYQAAADTLSEASKLSKNLEQQELITECLTFSSDVMVGKLTAAQKENEFVYHEKVPAATTLAEVKGASLVKGIPFSVNDPEVSGQDIFIKLVPLEAHQASSMYSEEKAKLLRRMGSAIQEKNDELETYLASMQLDSLALDSDSEGLPQEMIEYCADLNASNGIKKLTDTMAKISGFYHDINATLNEIKRLLEGEEEKEKEFLTVMGKRAPNMIVGELRRESGKYREAQQSAQDNNTALHRAITTHLPNLQLLAKPLDQLTAAIPFFASVEGQGDPAAKQEVQRLLGKVREMQDQRETWEAQLRSDIHNDDVTKQLVTSQEDMEDFFKMELKKHERLVSYLEQNMSAQTNILQALSEANAAYATTRRLTNQVQAKRTEMISSLTVSYNAYVNILKKAEDAQDFYRKLEGQVNKLASRVKSVCRVQDEEREEVLSANVKKFTGGSIPKGSILPSQPPSIDPSSSSVTGPKLKDYLQHMKGGSGIGAGVAIGGGVMTLPQSQGQPGYAYNDPSASYSSSMRPAPLGSEQSDPQTSCSGQGGYMAGYSGQVSAYYPSAPSPAPSPAPQSSGSPYKTPYGVPSGQYYPHQAATSAYPGATNTTAFPTPQSSTLPSASAPAPSSAAATTTHQSAPITAGQPSNYKASGSGAQQPTPYSYSGQYPYYGYQNAGGMAPVGPGSGGVSQGSPHHARQHVSPQHQGGTGYPAAASTGYGTGVHTTSTSGGASQVNATGIPQASHPPSGSVAQGYYEYYHQQQQQHPSAASAASSVPATVSSVVTATQLPFPQHPYQFAPTPSIASASSMYSQAGSIHSANYRPDAMSPSGGVVYMNQGGYSGQDGASKGQTPTTQTTPAYPSQEASYSSGMYSSAYVNGSSSANQAAAPANSTAPTSTQTGEPCPVWNMYSSYPQAGIRATSVSQAGGIASTSTSMSSLPQSPHSSTTAPTTTTAGSAAANVTQASALQPAQYGRGFSQSMMWAQYSSEQPYQAQQQRPTQPQQQQHQPHPQQQQQQYPQQHYPQQQTQQPQHQPQHPQPQQQQQPQQYPQATQQYPQPTQQYPQQTPQMPQSKQVPTTTTTTTASVPSASTGISNLDLLSGIELTTPAISQWSPLTPQPAGGKQEGEGGGRQAGETGSSTSVAPSSNTPASLSRSGAAPDLTSTATSVPATQLPPAPATNLPNIVSSNTAAINTSTSHTVPPMASSILDLTALAKNRKASVIDPLSDDDKLQKLAIETERLSKIVEGLDRKSLNGPTNLDLKWKELVEVVEKECGELKVSVARCYPLKNRFADILPYDHTRVTLPSTRDDYINASHVQLTSVEEMFPLILTQAPMPSTFADFWTMVWEQGVEMIVCLNSDAEVKGQVYVPSEVSSSCDYGPLSIVLHTMRQGGSPASIQRVLHVTHRTTKLTHVIIHLQFLGWPPSAMPENPSLLLQFIVEVQTFQRQQRNKLRPLMVHCVPGLARSGVLTVLAAFIREIHASGSLLELASLVVELSRQRRGGVQDKEHLHFLFSAALYYAQDVLMKRGILTNKATFEEGPREKTHVRHPSADLLSQYDLSRLKSKLGFDQEGRKSGSEDERSRSNSVASLLSNGSVAHDDNQGNDGQKDGQQDMEKEHDPTSLSTGVARPDVTAEVLNDFSGREDDIPGNEIESNTCNESGKSTKGIDSSFAALPPSLAASLDPQQFKLDPPMPGKGGKITKESFDNLRGGLSKADDPSDPFSGLDPLWSHKKS